MCASRGLAAARSNLATAVALEPDGKIVVAATARPKASTAAVAFPAEGDARVGRGDTLEGPVINDQFRAWLDGYGRAFEEHDATAAAALFGAEATYQWGPFGDLLRGREEIRARWAQAIDRGDEEVSFDYEILAVTDEIGCARWMASYTYPAEACVVRYDGVFAVRLTSESLCLEFREWWNTREEALPDNAIQETGPR